MTTQEMIAVMQAEVDGKRIQYRVRNTNQEWDDVEAKWNWAQYEYRVKPGPREWWIAGSAAFMDSKTAKRYANPCNEAGDDIALEIIHVREVIE